MTKPTVEQLQQSWDEYLKVGIYQDQRFQKIINYTTGVMSGKIYW